MACFLEPGHAAGYKKKTVPTTDIVFADELLNADLKDTVRTESFHKAYTVTLEKHKLYQIVLTGQAFTPRLRLETAARDQLDISVNKPGGSTIYHRLAKSDEYVSPSD